PGRRLLVQWRDGQAWQARVAIAPATADELLSIMEVQATPDQMAGGKVWWCGTPDGDVYPHCLDVEPLSGLILCDDAGRPDRTTHLGSRFSNRTRVYGSDWTATPLEFGKMIKLALGDLWQEPRPGAAAAGAGAAASLIEVGSRALPSPSPDGWQVVWSSGGTPRKSLLANLTVDEFAVCDVGGLAVKGSEVLLLRRSAGVDGDLDSDARVLSIVQNSSGERRRSFKDSVKEMTETSWAAWHEAGVGGQDVGCQDHELAMRIIEVAVVYDQLNFTELASFELLLRRAQLAEMRYQEAAAMKERRKLTEERQASRAPGGGGGGGASAAATQGLQQKVNAQASEIGRQMDKEHLHAWAQEVLVSINELYGHGTLPVDGRVSLAQGCGLERFRRAVEDAGPQPACNAAAAHRELCGPGNGYVFEPEHIASCGRPLAPLPKGGGLADGGRILEGEALQQWVGWRQLLKRQPEGGSQAPKPHYDGKFRSRATNAQFVGDLLDAGVVSLKHPREETVGAFFVHKSNGMQRLIIDPRCVNDLIEAPVHAVLPTAGAWSALEAPMGQELHLAQAGVDSAFYRIGLPGGAQEMFVLRAVHLPTLLRLRPDLRDQLPAGVETWASPCLEVLHMGWTWSLYFCQCMVMAGVQAAGFALSDSIQDRRAAPSVARRNRAAVYVDGVAVVGLEADLATSDCERVAAKLEALGLKCKSVEAAGSGATFTGLSFEVSSGKIRLSRSRTWKLRLAPLHAASRGWASGDELRHLLGHWCWAAILRRELLGVFAQTCRFIALASSRRWRLWPRVEAELWRAAALVCFASVDAERPCSTAVTVSDASGASPWDFGGRGAMEIDWGLESVRAAAGQAEKWRWSVSEAIAARAQTLGLPQVAGFARRTSCVQRGEGWYWGSGIGYALGLPRELAHLFLCDNCDNMSMVLALSKGRDPRSARYLDAHAADALLDQALEGEIDNHLLLQPGGAEAASLCGLGGTWLDEPAAVVGRQLAPAESAAATLVQTQREAALETAAAGLSYMQASRAQPQTVAHYRAVLSEFERWAEEQDFNLETPEALDQALSAHMGSLFFKGYNRDQGEKLIAAVKYFDVHGQSQSVEALPRARAALRGFRKRAPGQSRAPLPRPCLAALVGAALFLGAQELAIALKVAWCAYLRPPSDLNSMTGSSLIPPQQATGVVHWALLLYLEEKQPRSKTGHWDEGCLLDSDQVTAMGPLLAALVRRAGPSRPLWSFSAVQFRVLFRKVAQLAGLPDLGPHLVRHGSASADALHQTRDMHTIQERLRHAQEASTRRHKKHTRYLRELDQLAPDTKQHGEYVDANFGALLAKRKAVAAPPGAKKAAALAAGQLWRSGDTLGSALQLPAATARCRLRAALDQALGQHPRKAQAFLHLFAGTGRVGKWLEKLSALPALRLDVKADPAFDLTSDAALKIIR
ncbi:unnamed protein product, partial [Prorocentrum cordatum]